MKIFSKYIHTKQNEGLKALVLSDLHIFDLKDMKKIEMIMTSLKSKVYDVIYLVGDIIDSTKALLYDSQVYYDLLTFISYLGYVAPTYIVYGSHDISIYNIYCQKWIDDFFHFNSQFLEVVSGFRNINILENETKYLKYGYTISGFNPPLKYAYNKPDGDTDVLLEEGGFEFLNNLNPNNTNTFLCHYPAVITDLAKEGYLDTVDLGIAGHTHNGMTQFRFLPVELILNLFGQANRGIITAAKSFNLQNTKNLRGVSMLNDRCTLVINPAVTSLAACAGALRNLEGLFYAGATEINYVPKEEMKLQREKH